MNLLPISQSPSATPLAGAGSAPSSGNASVTPAGGFLSALLSQLGTSEGAAATALPPAPAGTEDASMSSSMGAPVDASSDASKEATTDSSMDASAESAVLEHSPAPFFSPLVTLPAQPVLATSTESVVEGEGAAVSMETLLLPQLSKLTRAYVPLGGSAVDVPPQSTAQSTAQGTAQSTAQGTAQSTAQGTPQSTVQSTAQNSTLPEVQPSLSVPVEAQARVAGLRTLSPEAAAALLSLDTSAGTSPSSETASFSVPTLREGGAGQGLLGWMMRRLEGLSTPGLSVPGLSMASASSSQPRIQAEDLLRQVAHQIADRIRTGASAAAPVAEPKNDILIRLHQLLVSDVALGGAEEISSPLSASLLGERTVRRSEGKGFPSSGSESWGGLASQGAAAPLQADLPTESMNVSFAARVERVLGAQDVAAQAPLQVGLDVPELGEGARILVGVRGDMVHARIISTDPAAAERMAQQLPELQRALEAQGFDRTHLQLSTLSAKGVSMLSGSEGEAARMSTLSLHSTSDRESRPGSSDSRGNYSEDNSRDRGGRSDADAERREQRSPRQPHIPPFFLRS